MFSENSRDHEKLMQSVTASASSSRERLGLAIGDCARLWRLQVNERLKPLGLSQGTWLALWHLSCFPDGLVQAELADRLGIEGPTLVRLLDRLEGEGLVLRTADCQDRRCKRVVLTPQANPLLEKVRQIIAGLRGELMAGFDESDVGQALALLELLRDRLSVQAHREQG